jgi:hypothetical protein
MSVFSRIVMRGRSVFAAGLASAMMIMVSGCAQRPVITVTDFSQPMAEFRDTIKNHDGYKAEIYFISEIDGDYVKNVMMNAIEGNIGRGFKMRIAEYQRWLPIRQMTLHLRAKVHTGAPIQAIAGQLVGSYKSAERTLVFTPKIDGHYAVRGALSSSEQDVWLEDIDTEEKFR